MLGDDAELTAAVRAAQDGDETAFRTVYRAVHPRLLGYVRTLVGEPDAEDVTSEAWLQIARDLERFTGDADRFRGWAARIARNRALDHIRMRGRRPAIGGDETELTGRAGESDTAGRPSRRWPPTGRSPSSPGCRRTRPRPSSCGWWWASTPSPPPRRWASVRVPYGRPRTGV
ncbi:hypothetical protein SHKM778_11470 [Streptomyces sp. KM77-8]|uniref:RNA polymerase sigma-70 region 2 domain-containing protein n=1 Tax=Streptomyces haneummycinicus TaxID=3074435 RepID=A0AAT9HBI4_9ACTN